MDCPSSETAMASIGIRNLCYQLPSKKNPLFSIDGDFCFDTGKITLIRGKSGCGKTTLLGILGLLHRFEKSNLSGSVTLRIDQSAWKYCELTPSQSARLRAQYFGFVSQSSYLISDLTCLDNLTLASSLADSSNTEIDPPISQLLEEVFAADNTDSEPIQRIKDGAYPHELSVGQRQRFSLVCALAKKPRIIFADEPTANLDDDNRNRMFKILESWIQRSSDQRLAIVISHDSKIIQESGYPGLDLDSIRTQGP
jgi:putative ABC transport system ATP-binding protein